MKIPGFTVLMVLFCFTGCSQGNGTVEQGNKPGKIPIDASRWYQLNHVSSGLEELFDGKLQQKPNTGWGKILDRYDSWYPLLDGETMTIDSIKFFDWEGTNADHPMTVYAVTKDWKRLPIGVFTGMRYNAWDGPDPLRPDVFKLDKPVSDIRALVINSWGDFPGEIEFYGPYTPPKPMAKVNVKSAALRNFFGINAFEWDFEAPGNPSSLDPVRLAAIRNFTGVRHYLDWEKIEGTEGRYSFSPASSGGWNYDTIYHWCHDQGIEVLVCLKTVPSWMQAAYPPDQKDAEDIPVRYGADAAMPASYVDQAKAGFQFAARYGHNKNVDLRLLTFSPGNLARVGLGYISYMECDNERDKWWKGRKAYQTGREYAANLSAFYDGNKNTMGPGVGVKNADPTLKVLMAGLADPTTDYVKGMIDWCKEYRGFKTDGSLDLPWDIINYHYYSNNADKEGKHQTAGVAPELSAAGAVADSFIRVAHQYAGDMPVWVTEAGYDLNPESPQKAVPTGNKKAQETQADWLLRTSLLYARAGIQKVFYYELSDDNAQSGARYATSGLTWPDRSPRMAANYFAQVNKLFGDYTFTASISTNPVVDEYEYGGKFMYVLYMPTQEGKTGQYALSLDVDEVTVCTLNGSTGDMQAQKRKVVNGKIDVAVTETPVFVVK